MTNILKAIKDRYITRTLTDDEIMENYKLGGFPVLDAELRAELHEIDAIDYRERAKALAPADRWLFDDDGKADTTKLEQLTPVHPRWRDFAEQLSKALDCDPCDHDHRRARRVMAEMGGFDIDASLAYFEAHGGYCDCEIMFNVDDDDLDC
jgi:hypothetical protein